MIIVAVSLLPLAIWAYLLFGRGWFWLCRERDDSRRCRTLAETLGPSVVAIIPARDEADMIAQSVGSLLRQDYPGRFSVVVVDDQSTDGTAAAALAAASAAQAADRLQIVTGTGPPPGWTGKLSAMRQGLAEVEAGAATPEFVLFTDADIAYAPHVLSRLVAIARAKNSVLTSLMVKLRCESAAERWLAPAFVFFFQMLYPFAWVNDPRRATAAAAGGCMLVRRETLHAAGGLEAVRGALIDDCALGRAHEGAGADLARPDRGRSQLARLSAPSPISAGWWRARPSPNCAIRRCASLARSAGWRLSISRRRCSPYSRGAWRKRPARSPGR